MSHDLIKRLESDVQKHGEVHAVIEEHDDELEVRQGTTDFDYQDGVITVDDGTTLHRVGMDRVVRWYFPVEAFH